jgi:hypothetical protein
MTCCQSDLIHLTSPTTQVRCNQRSPSPRPNSRCSNLPKSSTIRRKNTICVKHCGGQRFTISISPTQLSSLPCGVEGKQSSCVIRNVGNGPTTSIIIRDNMHIELNCKNNESSTKTNDQIAKSCPCCRLE